ncbi:hypothetical protein [Embleya sp. NPDC005971]|uniref:hypothetical protein n=1 Tax=Embleya sp. NPDC005971 TaxID=3156724 RepID=UPI0033D5C67E
MARTWQVIGDGDAMLAVAHATRADLPPPPHPGAPGRRLDFPARDLPRAGPAPARPTPPPTPTDSPARVLP